MPKPKTTKLSVFKGREAKLNHAIFQTLALKGPQTVYDIHKNVKKLRGLRYTHYGNISKRVRALLQQGYVRQLCIRRSKAGFEAIVYDLALKAYAAIILDSISLDALLDRMDEVSAMGFLAVIATLNETKRS